LNSGASGGDTCTGACHNGNPGTEGYRNKEYPMTPRNDEIHVQQRGDSGSWLRRWIASITISAARTSISISSNNCIRMNLAVIYGLLLHRDDNYGKYCKCYNQRWDKDIIMNTYRCIRCISSDCGDFSDCDFDVGVGVGVVAVDDFGGED
jgi:hypothetical protein